MSCFICGHPASLSCPNDGCEVMFCCQAHADLHLDSNGACYPYTVKWTEDVGRFVVASRDIKQGEVIFAETEPLVVGPNQECLAICLTCLEPISELEFTCDMCGYPVCSTKCGQLHQESPECSMLSQGPTPVFDEVTNHVRLYHDTKSDAYHPILPLRLLLLSSDQEKSRLAELFMDHLEDRRHSQYWPYCENNIVPFIHSICGGKFTEEQIMRAIGILEVNCYEVKNYMTFGVRGFYPLASLLSHSCVANVRTIWQTEAPFGHKTIAMTDIKQGEEILTSYLRSSLCSLTRRKTIKEGWYFDCKCRRCCDATEMGTHCNTLTCPACKDGLVLPKDPLDYTSDWQCDKCGLLMDYVQVTKIVDNFNERIKHLYENDR